MAKRRAIRVDRFKCVLCGGEYRSADTADKCVAACSERDLVEQAAADGTLAKTEERLDHAEMVADMREVTDADVGESVHPLECVIDVLDYVLVHHTPPVRIRRSIHDAKAICRNQILLDKTEPLRDRSREVAMDAIDNALARSGDE